MTQSASNNPTPTLEEFISWEYDQIQRFTAQKTVVFSPGGSSRWYFLEHGNINVGYAEAERFADYVGRTFQRILEIVLMMFQDGIPNVIVIGMTPKLASRNLEYSQHLGWSSEMLINDEAHSFYELHGIAPVFRGGWDRILEHVGAPLLLERFVAYERETPGNRRRRLFWVAEDDPLPTSLVPMVMETYQQTGRAPDRAALARAYYGQRMEHADLFISNNKPSIEGQIPPLLTVGDLYFTVSPSLYMDFRQWRSILYDHMVARRGHYRDYSAIQPEAFNELRSFYYEHRSITLGVGTHHQATQTWRPQIASSLWQSPEESASA